MSQASIHDGSCGTQAHPFAMKRLFRHGAVTVAALFLFGARAAAQITFFPGPQADLPQAPQFVATADFNRDGIADAAVTDPTSRLVTVLLGAPDGAFRSPRTFSVGHELRGIAAGDLNCDGNADIAVVDSSDDHLFVATGNGDGTFGQPAAYLTGKGPVDVVIGNFDGQSCADVAVLNQADGTVSIFRNLGRDRGFEVHDFAVGDLPLRLKATDLDGNGVDDLVTIVQGAAGPDAVAVLINAGDGSFSGPRTFAVNPGSIDLTVADFNDDGAPDIAVLNADPSGATPHSVALLPQQVDASTGEPIGTGAFPAMQGSIQLPCPANLNLVPIVCTPTSIAAGDYDGDGFVDLVVSSSTRPVDATAADTPGFISGFGGQGDGTLDFSTQTLIGVDPAAIGSADLTGDGLLDIVVTERTSRAVLIARMLTPIYVPSHGCRLNDQCGSGCCVGGLCKPSTVCEPGASITLSVPTGGPGDRLTFDVTLQTRGSAIAGTQNDISFDSGTPIAAAPNGRPDCTANPAINKLATNFAFRPGGCTPGRDCTAIRVLVLSTDNVDPIDDGALLYTCAVRVGDATPPGSYALAVSGEIASDPNGNQVPFSGIDGAVVVNVAGGTPFPTWTVSPTPSPKPPRPTYTPFPTMTQIPTRGPTDTPRPSVAVSAGSATAGPGDTVDVTVTLASGPYGVAGIQANLAGTAGLTIAAQPNGDPDCRVNPDIDKSGTSFLFLPFHCQAATNCTAVRALVLAFDNVEPIPDGAVLFTCRIHVAATPPGHYGLFLSDVVASDPNGAAWNVLVHEGEIVIITPPGTTPVPTWTAGSVDVNVPPASAPTPTSTARAPGDRGTVSGVSGQTSGSGGCTADPERRDPLTVPLLVLPAVVFLLRKRYGRALS